MGAAPSMAEGTTSVEPASGAEKAPTAKPKALEPRKYGGGGQGMGAGQGTGVGQGMGAGQGTGVGQRKDAGQGMGAGLGMGTAF